MTATRDAAKAALLAACAPTGGGIDASPEQDAAIEALAVDLSGLASDADPQPVIDKIAGRWRLVYGSFKLERETTLFRLSFGKLPKTAITVNNVFQEVKADGSQYDNPVEFTFADGPAKGLVGVQRTCGHFALNPEMPARLDITFTAARYGPKYEADRARWQAALGEVAAVADAEVSFGGWSDILYLDDDTRLMRGNAGNLYVLVREIG